MTGTCAALRVLLQTLVLSKLSFALYRLPNDEPRLLLMEEGQPQCFASLNALDTSAGFVMVPFVLSASHKLVLWPQEQCVKAKGWGAIEDLLRKLLMQPDFAALYAKVEAEFTAKVGGEIVTLAQGQYRQDFACFSQALLQGQYQKLVLSSYFEQETPRCYVYDNFMRACSVKPELMVTLLQAPQVGTWFVATPEVLLRSLSPSDGGDQKLHTMALAGTMPYSAENMELKAWSRKDREEQALVTSYLTAILEQGGSSYETQWPYPVKAGSVVHLRTDLTFSLPKSQGLSEILAALHPTPAVCGLPKAAAQNFILEHESYERSYYAGFLGEINCGGKEQQTLRTNLFVNLRTIEFLKTHQVWGPWSFRSYVGGGLLAASTENSEYAEICAKNRSVLSNLKPELWNEA